MKKNKIFSKFNMKDYNTELEEILDKKIFSEEAKNLLLNMFYKIENFYDDYKLVNKQAADKDIFIEMILKYILEDCNNITVLKPQNEKKQIQYRIKEKGKIEVFPNEAILLYTIVKNSTVSNKIANLNCRALKSTLIEGRAVSLSEVVRDFNGWSWTNILENKGQIYKNLIYNNSVILLNYYNLENILNSYDENIQDGLQDIITDKYSTHASKEFLVILYNICILMECIENKDLKLNIIHQKEYLENMLNKISDKVNFLSMITYEKRELSEKIKKIDKIFNNSDLIKKELEYRKEEIKGKDEKSNIHKLTKILEKERKEYLKKIKDYNELIDPKKFIEKKQEIEEKVKFYSQLKISKNENININQMIINLQIAFLECFKEKIEKCTTRMHMLNLIYEFRYYRLLKYKKDKFIKDEKKLQDKLDEVLNLIIEKGYEMRVFDKFSNNKEFNKLVINELFNSKVLRLENVAVQIIETEDSKYLQYYDGNTLDVKIKIDMDDESNKLKRKSKIII